MGSAKVIIKQQDRSTIVPSLPGIYGGIVIRARKGEVNKPILVTSESELVDKFGIPDTRYPEFYSAITYLQQSDKLWVVRAAHNDVKYSAALVRSKVIYPDTTNPLADFTDEMRIVQPLKDGLTEEELKNYQFPLYEGNRVYEDYSNKIHVLDRIQNGIVQVDNLADLKVGDKISFSDSVQNIDVINSPDTDDGELLWLFTIKELKTETNEYDEVDVDSAIKAEKGTEIYKVDSNGNYIAYPNHPKVAISSQDDSSVIVDNADYIQPGDKIAIGIGGPSANVEEKTKTTINEYYIILDKEYSDDLIPKMVLKLIQSEHEERDSFLVTGANPSVDFNKVSIGIAPSKNYEEAFNILVYYDGVLVETWEVTKEDFIDGFGNQLYLEDVINGKSKYIKVLDNKNNPNKPLYTDHSYWRRLSEDYFKDTGIQIEENILRGHTQVKVNTTNGLSVGDRIKFKYDIDRYGNPVISKEYKIQSIDASNNQIFLDRPLEEEEIDRFYYLDDGGEETPPQHTTILKFDKTYNDTQNGIYHGVKYYPITELDKVFYNYPIGKIITIGDYQGTLLDAGANLLMGGSEGSPVTLGDMVNALNTLSNRGETPVTLLMQGGYYNPAYAQALVEIAKKQDLTHVYLSSDPNAEDMADWKTALVNYMSSLNLDTEKASLFAGWVKIFDRYNQKYVWVGPDAFAAAAQSYTQRNYEMWYPAAGWLRGKITVIDSKIKPDEGTRDYLIDNKINPIKYVKGSGFVIWGNRTLYTKPSPLNDRNVAMLLIVIKYGLKNMLEYKLFELNTERTWNEVETSIRNFLDDIKAKNGLYDYQVAVKSIITPEDIDNNRMPVFVGIKPTRAIKEIPVTLAIYNMGAKIEVKL